MNNGVIIDYKMGNVASVKKAFQKIGASIVISNKKTAIERADYLILPGVGAFRDGIKNLKKLGLVKLLTKKVLKDKVPFLGICLGMQLLAEKGQEFGVHDGLGWIKGEAVKLNGEGLRLPHVGWDDIKVNKENSVILDDIPDNNFYFAHSYYLKPADKKIISSTCDYGDIFPASIHKDNIFATQFHPEKSQNSGLRLLENFLNYAKN